jgi:hypothetical protein
MKYKLLVFIFILTNCEIVYSQELISTLNNLKQKLNQLKNELRPTSIQRKSPSKSESLIHEISNFLQKKQSEIVTQEPQPKKQKPQIQRRILPPTPSSCPQPQVIRPPSPPPLPYQGEEEGLLPPIPTEESSELLSLEERIRLAPPPQETTPTEFLFGEPEKPSEEQELLTRKIESRGKALAGSSIRESIGLADDDTLEELRVWLEEKETQEAQAREKWRAERKKLPKPGTQPETEIEAGGIEKVFERALELENKIKESQDVSQSIQLIDSFLVESKGQAGEEFTSRIYDLERQP